MLSSERCIGQIVQVLNNNIDQGKILSFLKVKFIDLIEKLFMKHSLSKFSLEKAIKNLKDKKFLSKTSGTNYTILVISRFKISIG